MDALPIIAIIALLMFIFGRIRIPKGLKPVPAIEFEVHKDYQIQVRINGKDFVKLPLSDAELDDFKRDKKNLSKSNFCLKHKREDKSKIEVLLNLTNFVHLEDDSFTVELEYTKPVGKMINLSFAEIDYSLAFIHNGKLLTASDIQEKNFRLDGKGQQTIHFTDLSERVAKRIKKLSGA
ncbi:MAG: hypothetical protein AB8B83_08340 [Bdellovibrionales bacterium]